MSLLFPRALCSPHQTGLRCNTGDVERSLSLYATFQAHLYILYILANPYKWYKLYHT
jgi:hypothetical protein